MAKQKKLSDDEILNLVALHKSEGVRFLDSTLSTERTEIQRYYDGELPKPSHKGNSKFVSLDVYDSVEAMKATLLETFAAGEGIGRFDAQNAKDVQPCEIATTYTDYVIFRQNKGYKIFGTVIQDGLMARLGVVKAYWQDLVEDQEEEFGPVDMQQLTMLLSAPDVELKDFDTDDEGNTTGTLVRKVDKRQVVIDTIAPEDFIVSPRARNLEDFPCTERSLRSRSDLLKDGYDKQKVEELVEDSANWETDPEVLARYDAADNSTLGGDAGEQEASQKIWVYETYIDLDCDGTGKTYLYKICWAGNQLLDKEQIARKPFAIFTPLPRAHALIGSNFAKKVIPTQNAKTVLMRGILDHTVITNNPRYLARIGAVPKPDELLENRIGGVVNVRSLDAVTPLLQAPLNPFVFQTIQLIDYELEDTTGVSKLSQGMNKDAVSKQNSQGLIEQLTTASMQRQKIVARNFAEGFLKPLYELVYSIVVENEDRQKIVEVAGKWIEINPSTWAQKRDYTVSLHLGYGEFEKQANDLAVIDQLLKQTPFYGPQHQYNVLKKALEYKGYKDVDSYIMRPEQVKPPSPPPEIMLKKKELQIKADELKWAMQKGMLDHKRDMEKLSIERLRIQSDHAIKADKLDLEEVEHKDDMKIAQRELEQADKALEQAAEETKFTGIASPNS